MQTWRKALNEAYKAKESGEIVLIERTRITYCYPEKGIEIVFDRIGSNDISEPRVEVR